MAAAESASDTGNSRCLAAVLPRGETEVRQCLNSCVKNSVYCHSHDDERSRPLGDYAAAMHAEHNVAPGTARLSPNKERKSPARGSPPRTSPARASPKKTLQPLSSAPRLALPEHKSALREICLTEDDFVRRYNIRIYSLDAGVRDKRIPALLGLARPRSWVTGVNLFAAYLAHDLESLPRVPGTTAAQIREREARQRSALDEAIANETEIGAAHAHLEEEKKTGEAWTPVKSWRELSVRYAYLGKSTVAMVLALERMRISYSTRDLSSAGPSLKSDLMSLKEARVSLVLLNAALSIERDLDAWMRGAGAGSGWFPAADGGLARAVQRARIPEGDAAAVVAELMRSERLGAWVERAATQAGLTRARTQGIVGGWMTETMLGAHWHASHLHASGVLSV